MNDIIPMFYAIVDLLPVHDSINLFNQEDGDILITFLAAITEFAIELNTDIWYQLMHPSQVTYMNYTLTSEK